MMDGTVLYMIGGIWLIWRLWQLAMVDLCCGLLYDRLVLIVALSSVYPYLGGVQTLDSMLAGGGVGWGLLWLLRLISRGGIGWGDIKLAGAIGLWLGARGTLVSLAVAFGLGGIVAMGLIGKYGYSCSAKIPFGPFLAVGGSFGYWFGLDCWQWYEALL